MKEIERFLTRVRAVVEDAERDRALVLQLRSVASARLVAPPTILERRPRLGDGELLSFIVGARDGVRIGDVMQAFGVTRRQAAMALRRLRTAGAIELKGTKRRSCYVAR